MKLIPSGTQSKIIIFGMMFIFISILLAFITKIMYDKRHSYVSGQPIVNSKASNDKNDNNIIIRVCPEGQCAVNYINGSKRCATNKTEELVYDPSLEVCTYPDTCPTEIPYPINSDGSTNTTSKCTGSVPCRCSKVFLCPDHITTSLKTVNGLPGASTSLAEYLGYTITQNVGSDDGTGFFNLNIENTAIEICKINPNYTNRMTQGCDLSIGLQNPQISMNYTTPPSPDDDSANYKNMLACVNNNPCLKGSFSYLIDTKDPKEFMQYDGTNIDTYTDDAAIFTLSCSIGLGCNPSIDDPHKKLKVSKTITSTELLDPNDTNSAFTQDVSITTNLGNSYNYTNFSTVKDLTRYYNISSLKVGDTFGPSGMLRKILTLSNTESVITITLDNGDSISSIPGKTRILLKSGALNEVDNVKVTAEVFAYVFSNVSSSYLVVNDQFQPADSLPEQTIATISKETVCPAGNYLFTKLDVTNNETYIYCKSNDIDKTGRYYPDFDPCVFSGEAYAADGTLCNGTRRPSFPVYDNSYYYPVWDPQRYQNICVRAYPLFVCYGTITSGTVTKLTIQISGADFGHYIWNGTEYQHPTTKKALEMKVNYDSQKVKNATLAFKEGDIGKDGVIKFSTDDANIITNGSGYATSVTVVNITISKFDKP